MSSDASGSEFLAAREQRDRLLRDVRASAAGALVFATTNIPGADKDRPGLDALLEVALVTLGRAVGPVTTVAAGRDRLGPFRAVAAPADPEAVKRAAVSVEESLPFGRLIDLDVYDEAGRPIDRAALALPQRACLVCAEPARECIRTGRHAPRELEEAVRGLVASARHR